MTQKTEDYRGYVLVARVADLGARCWAWKEKTPVHKKVGGTVNEAIEAARHAIDEELGTAQREGTEAEAAYVEALTVVLPRLTAPQLRMLQADGLAPGHTRRLPGERRLRFAPAPHPPDLRRKPCAHDSDDRGKLPRRHESQPTSRRLCPLARTAKTLRFACALRRGARARHLLRTRRRLFSEPALSQLPPFERRACLRRPHGRRSPPPGPARPSATRAPGGIGEWIGV